MNTNKNMEGALRSAVSGIPYPASKNEIISYARTKATGNDALDILNEIPAREYGSEEELMSVVRDELATREGGVERAKD